MEIKPTPNYPDSKNRNSFEEGIEFQDYVAQKMLTECGIAFTNYQSRRFQFCNGENRQGIEIKLDKGITRFGNVSIEIAERTSIKMPWVDSGIYRGDNTWLYIQGNLDILFIFAKSTLLLLHKSGRYLDEITPPGKETLKRFRLTCEEARKYAAKVIESK